MPEGDQRRLRVNDGVTFQSTGPGADTVLLSLSSGYLYTCNDTTSDFLRALDGKRTFGEIVETLCDQFDVTPEQLRNDLQDLTDNLLREELIAEVSADGGK